jgi:hypothetical protein
MHATTGKPAARCGYPQTLVKGQSTAYFNFRDYSEKANTIQLFIHCQQSQMTINTTAIYRDEEMQHIVTVEGGGGQLSLEKNISLVR